MKSRSLLVSCVQTRRCALARIDGGAAELEDPLGNRADHRVHSLPGDRGHLEVGYPGRLDPLAQLRRDLRGSFDIDLVADHDLGPVCEFCRMQFELAVDGVVVFERIARLVAAREVDHVDDERCALDVSQELVPEPLAFAGALDEAGNVGHDEGPLAGPDHTEVGDEGGEGIVGDLGARRTHATDEGALPDAGHPHQGRVGEQLHLELDPSLLGGLAEFRKGRSAAGRGDEMDVAAAAVAALSHLQRLALQGEVTQNLAGLGVPHDRAERDLQHHIRATGTVPDLAFSVRPAFGLEVSLEPEVDERRDRRIGLQDHGRAAAAIAAVRAPLGNVGFSTERHAARAAVPSFDVNLYLVDEHVENPLSAACGTAVILDERA